MRAAELRPSTDGDELRRDAVDDLVLYRPYSAGDLPAGDFLAQAKERLALGHHVYTWAEGGVLLRADEPFVDPAIQSGGDHAQLLGGLVQRDRLVIRRFGWWLVAGDAPSSSACSLGSWARTRSIQRRLQDAAAAGHERMFIGVLADNAPSRHNIEKLGFRYCASGWARYRFGRVRLWITCANSGVACGSATPGDMRAPS